MSESINDQVRDPTTIGGGEAKKDVTRHARAVETRKFNSQVRALNECIQELNAMSQKPFSLFPIVRFKEVVKKLDEDWKSFKKGKF